MNRLEFVDEPYRNRIYTARTASMIPIHSDFAMANCSLSLICVVKALKNKRRREIDSKKKIGVR